MIFNKPKKFHDYVENLRLALKKAKYSEYTFCSIILMLAAALAYIATHQLVTLVPYNLGEKVEVAINKMSYQYLIAIGSADAALFFDYDPSNVKTQAELFLARVYPEIYGDTQIKLLSRSKEVIQSNISQVFYPAKFFTELNNKTVTIYGRLVNRIVDKLIKSENIALKISYQIENGYTYIKDWSYHAAP